MKKRFTAKNPMRASITDHEQPPDASANGTWHCIAMKTYALFEQLEQRGREEEHAVEDGLTAEAIVTGTTE